MKIHCTVPATATEAANVKSRESSHRPLNTKVVGTGSRLFEIIKFTSHAKMVRDTCAEINISITKEASGQSTKEEEVTSPSLVSCSGLMTAPRPVIHEHKSEIITGNLAGCHPRKVLNANIFTSYPPGK